MWSRVKEKDISSSVDRGRAWCAPFMAIINVSKIRTSIDSTDFTARVMVSVVVVSLRSIPRVFLAPADIIRVPVGFLCFFFFCFISLADSDTLARHIWHPCRVPPRSSIFDCTWPFFRPCKWQSAQMRISSIRKMHLEKRWVGGRTRYILNSNCSLCVTCKVLLLWTDQPTGRPPNRRWSCLPFRRDSRSRRSPSRWFSPFSRNWWARLQYRFAIFSARDNSLPFCPSPPWFFRYSSP